MAVDSSVGGAVVPLCCSQAFTRRSRQLARDLGRIVVWWGTPVEARGAFAQRVRDGAAPAGRDRAIRLLNRLRPGWDEIMPSEQVRALAESLPDEHVLRSADAFQLAAALVWCRERPRRRPFVCFDGRLARAAEAAGFKVYRETQ